ncbi:hypothetical protein GPALN_002127 [Globodera pallida]|nr:hypothetical protein GPALN_002127 [Globodera pallida]
MPAMPWKPPPQMAQLLVQMRRQNSDEACQDLLNDSNDNKPRISMDTIFLLGANVFLTGANRGIGLGLVKEKILKLGGVTNLFAGCRDPDQAQELKELAKCNKALKLVKIDVSSDESIKNAVSDVCKVLGSDDGLNTLINNAGILEKVGAK